VSKKTVLTVLVVAAAAAVMLPMLSCKPTEQVMKDVILFQQPETLTVEAGEFHVWALNVVDSMLRYDPKTAYLSTSLVCVSSSPDNRISWYLFTPEQYNDFLDHTPNPPAVDYTINSESSTLFYPAMAPGTFYAVIDNTGDTLHEKRVTGVISTIWYVME
jgi:hypothetical protein